MGRVAAIIVTYNRKALLLECVECLRRQTWQDLDIMIIDNASSDGTKEALEPYLTGGAMEEMSGIPQRVLYENTGANLGGAGGFQFGIRKAVEFGYDYVWVMDDDSMPTETALEKLMTAPVEEGYGFLSSRTLWTDGSLCRMNIPRDRKMNNITELAGGPVNCGAATFVSLLVPSSVVKDVGLPIKEFFIWADDLEYTRRISRKYPCYIIPDSVVVHKCSTNNGGNISTDSEDRIDRYRYAYRNEVYIYRREGLRGAARLLARTPVHIVRVLTRSRTKKGKRIGVIVGSTLRGLRFRPPVEYVDMV